MQHQLQLVRVFIYAWERALASYTEALGMPVARGARFLEPPNQHPPGYSTAFCPSCGSPAPDLTHVTAEDDWFELVAGVLDDEPMLRPDKHIFVDCMAAWDAIHDALPRLTMQELIELRIAAYRAKAKKRRDPE